MALLIYKEFSENYMITTTSTSFMTMCTIFPINNHQIMTYFATVHMYVFVSRKVYDLAVNSQDYSVYLLNKCLGNNDIVPISRHSSKYQDALYKGRTDGCQKKKEQQ